MTTPPSRVSRFTVRLAAGILLLNLIVVLLAALTLYESRQQHEEQAVITAKNLSLLLDQKLEHTFDKIDMALLAVAHETTRLLGSGKVDANALNAFAARQTERLPELTGIRIADVQGTLRYGTGLPPDTLINIADREHFIRLRDHPDAGLVVSKPIVSRTMGKLQIVLARRVSRQDGSFAGTVTAPLEIDVLTRQMEALDIGRHGLISLRDPELALVARYSAIGNEKSPPIGQKTISREFEEQFRRTPAAGVFRTSSLLDHITRTFSYRKVTRYPFYVVVGLASDDYLAEWWKDVSKNVILLLIFGLVTLGFSWRLVLAWRRREADLAVIRQQEQKFRILLESLPDPLVITDAQGRITLVNHQVTEVLGYPPQELIGQPVEVLLPQRYRGSHVPLRQGYVQAPRVREMGKSRLLWAVTKQGREVPINVSLSPIQTGQGLMVAAIIRDISERKAAEEQIAFLAYHDALTGLPNRQLIQDRFGQAIAHADRAATKTALLLLDLDNFKPINDSLGFPTGDALLQMVATRLRACVRGGDTVGRQSGDEFLVVLTDLPDAEAIIPIVLKLNEQLEGTFKVAEHELVTTASIGIAIYPDDGQDFDALLKKADLAMYQAKEAGRNTYRFFDPQVDLEVTEQLRMRSELRGALTHKEFVLYYQPQIDLASGAVLGAEALIRWRHPQLGLVPPGRFIPVAEDSGLIVSIGEWVLHEACRQAVAWRAAGLPEMVMAVNLSAVQFKRGQLEQTVLRALEESGLDPALLELELTESILIGDTENVLASVNQLKALGVKLSIDDFGTGYSSLSYLKRFPFDKLKIDQSFVRNLARDPEDAVIVRAIIQLAHSLGLRTIAEGVEDEALLNYLRIFHCDEAQGFHFARPLPADEFANYLATATRKAADQGPR